MRPCEHRPRGEWRPRPGQRDFSEALIMSIELVGRDSVEPFGDPGRGSTESRPTRLEIMRVLVLGLFLVVLAGRADAAHLAGPPAPPRGQVGIPFAGSQ